MQRLAGTLLLALVTVFIVVERGASKASACPNCKEAVSLDVGEVSNLSNGFNWSVVFMLSVPFSLLGTGALMVRHAVRNGSLPEL